MEEKNPHNLILNFSKENSSTNSHNVVLNFGESSESKDAAAFFVAEIQSPQLLINADFEQTDDVIAHLFGELTAPILNIEATSTSIPPIDAAFLLEIAAPQLSFSTRVVVSSNVVFVAEIQSPVLSIDAEYDFNVQRYTTADRSEIFKKTLTRTKEVYAPHQIVNQFKDQTQLKHQLTVKLDYVGGVQYESVQTLEVDQAQAWGGTKQLELSKSALHQSNDLRRQSGQQIWQETAGLNLIASDQYNDHLRTRKSSLNWWQQAIQTGVTKGFGFNATTWLKLLEHLRHQQTKRPNTGVWIPDPELGRPPYVGSGDLNFCCKCIDVDPLNVVLNFSDDPCCDDGETGHLDNKKVYFIMNEGYLKRVSDGAPIEVKSLNLSIDRDSWCWSFSASLPFTEELKVNTDEEYIEVELGLNGFIWHFLIESNTSNQQFASTDIQIKGRSLTAMLAEEAGTRSYNQTASASSVQLAQAELERITSATPFTLDWTLVDQTGWNVPANAWSYAELTPIKAIQEIAEGAGGFVSSHMKDRKLLIQPRYAYAPWEWVGLIPEVSIPFNLVLQRTREKDFKPEYNAVTVAAESQGIQAVVKHGGTAGDKMAPTAVTAFINSEQPARTMARAELSKYGKKRMYQDTIPLHPDVGVILPSKIIGMQDKDLSTWNGHSYGTSISANWNGDAGLKIRQTFTVERYIA